VVEASLPSDPWACRVVAVLPPGKALAVAEALHARGIERCAFWHARGSWVGDPPGPRGLAIESEQEMLAVVGPADQADLLFELVFDLAEIDRPGGGLVYLEHPRRATRLDLPDPSPGSG